MLLMNFIFVKIGFFFYIENTVENESRKELEVIGECSIKVEIRLGLELG